MDCPKDTTKAMTATPPAASQSSLISRLVGPYNGKPILVIGGGPTAAAVAHLPLDHFACVISANEHGFKQDRFKVDFIVSVDWYYGATRTPMYDHMAKYNTPHINRWSWADYRIPEWTFLGDSGLTAVAVAYMLGGHPIIAAGMDRYIGPKRYFWHETPDPHWIKRRVVQHPNVQVSVNQCIEFCQYADVACFGGPMKEHWRLVEAPGRAVWIPCKAPQCTLTGDLYTLRQPIFLHYADRVDDGPILLTKHEARGFLNMRKIEKLT